MLIVGGLSGLPFSFSAFLCLVQARFLLLILGSGLQEFSSQDSLLQTAVPVPGRAQMSMARFAPQMMPQMPAQAVMYAQAVPVKNVQQPQLAGKRGALLLDDVITNLESTTSC